MFEIRTGDCLEVLRGMADSSVDSIVTDPPYGLSFMGKKWDYDVPDVAVWAECLRVLKPGGHLLAFAGTRTQHRMAVRIEDAGFEIRDMIAWVYGSGFPKSLDVSKAIDKAAGAEREVVGTYKGASNIGKGSTNSYITTKSGKATDVSITAPATPAAQQWAGWGTALKPALEPITVARKPLVGTVAGNVLRHGTGAINVDGCRVNPGEVVPGGGGLRGGAASRHEGWQRPSHLENEATQPHTAGRWPANLIHDGSEEVVGLFPVTGASKASARGGTNPNPMDWGKGRLDGGVVKGHDDAGGSAARFFYCAKASKADRDEGLERFELRKGGAMSGVETRPDRPTNHPMRANHHPTVKPTALMRYLCRLVTPPGGLVLDPFAGSGSTGKGALLEGFRFVGIERDPEYVAIAQARCAAVQPGLPLA